MQSALELENLVKHYGTVKAVDGVSLSVAPGEVFGLLGPNGAGKTTIISILTTLESPTSGTASVFGEKVSPTNRNPKLLMGCVPQEIVSHGFFNVEEILRFYSGYYGLSHNEGHIEFLLKRLGLYEFKDRRARALSGGMKRRLLIAKALLHRPRLLLLDEPTAGVDVELRSQLWEFVRELNQQGTTVLLTTHYLEEAESLCDRIGFIHRGKLIRTGNTQELITQLTTREIIFILESPLSPIKNDHLISQTDGQLVFRVPNQVNLADLMRQLALPVQKIRDIKTREGRLEDAFIRIMAEKK